MKTKPLMERPTAKKFDCVTCDRSIQQDEEFDLPEHWQWSPFRNKKGYVVRCPDCISLDYS